eukprot:TRINITY_DN25453_c0_g2_i1.p1 TRINITY_DN25453_c0_g2~~TRINITY_DN25453_c0_g2_i1.p1  ORF type:complete len:199 (-),score=24.48 TRINITY_DN25453_c0_g2_i1:93-689(-)
MKLSGKSFVIPGDNGILKLEHAEEDTFSVAFTVVQPNDISHMDLKVEYQLIVAKDEAQVNIASACRVFDIEPLEESDIIVKELLCDKVGLCKSTITIPIEWESKEAIVVNARALNLRTGEIQEIQYSRLNSKNEDTIKVQDDTFLVMNPIVLVVIGVILFIIVIILVWCLKARCKKGQILPDEIRARLNDLAMTQTAV